MLKEIGLSWIVVKDLDKAVRYYVDVVGLRLVEHEKEFGWAELEVSGSGSRLGIAQENSQDGMKAGQNAVITFLVDDLESTKRLMGKKGALFEGDVVEVPGHIKMQTILDQDGNYFQICQKLGVESLN
jgi:predicted enzyme related to lactoylglutathione lyase